MIFTSPALDLIVIRNLLLNGVMSFDLLSFKFNIHFSYMLTTTGYIQ